MSKQLILIDRGGWWGRQNRVVGGRHQKSTAKKFGQHKHKMRQVANLADGPSLPMRNFALANHSNRPTSPMPANWFPFPADYRQGGFLSDLTAGFTLCILLIPQAMAYGMLAGVDPVYGLYAALVPMVIYALTASTPHVSVGPTALASLLCLNGLAGLAEPGSAEYLGYAVLLAGVTGALQLLYSILRLGGISSLLSRPVLSGFVSAAAVLIMVSQLNTLMGINAERAGFLHSTLLNLFNSLESFHWPTALLGGGTLIVLWLGSRFLPKKFPTFFLVVAISTVLVWQLGQSWDISTVGYVPSGLPSFLLPELSMASIREVLPVALVISLISFVETLSIGKAFAPDYEYYRVRPNRELAALGLSKIGGAFFQGIPTSASFSRSAVLEGAGGRSPVSGILSALMLVVVLLFLTPAFYYLPKPVLAAIIVFSVRNLFDLREMKRLWSLAPKEFFTLLLTFLFTLFAGLQYGIAGGVLLSLYFAFARAARPHLAELGRVEGTNAFRNVERFKGSVCDPTVLIVRFDSELYFSNADFFRDEMEALVAKKGDALRAVIIDGHTINDIDSSGIYALTRFLEGLERRNISLYLCGTIGPVRDMLFKSGLMERMGADRHFLSIQSALAYINDASRDRGWDSPAVQHG